MTPELVFLIGVGLLGACVGSFLNVVAYRLPRECLSIVRPRSACPRCRRPIPWSENLPILSYVVLGGRCRGCRAEIPPRYFLVELGTAVIFVGVALVTVTDPVGHPEALALLGVRWLVIGGLIALSLIDLDFRILPDEITKSGIVLGPLCAFAAPAVQPSAGPFAGLHSPRVDALAHGLAGALVSMAVLYGVGWLGAKAFRKEAMGLGDVKMIGAMGGFLGIWALLALVVASIAGAVLGGLRLLLTGSRYIPFGPFLALGMAVVMLWGRELLDFYLGTFAR